MAIGDTDILLYGKVVTIPKADQKFTRKLSLAGSHSPVRQQKRKCYIGNLALVACAGGPVPYTIIAVSTDGQSWRGDDGTERLTADILL